MTKARSNATANAAKGDLTVGNGTNLSGVLGVGSNGDTIVADSSTSTGLAWKSNLGLSQLSINSARTTEKLVISMPGSGVDGCYFNNEEASATSRIYINFLRATGAVGNISGTNTAIAYNTTSDYRLKENVNEIEGAINKVNQLKPVNFNFIMDKDNFVDGFIAHEVQTIVPNAVSGVKDGKDEDGNPLYQGVDYSKLVPILTAAIQELSAKVAALEAGN